MDIRKIAALFGGYDVGSGITTYYPLNEGGGINVEDVSQYGNHGTLKNGPVWGLVDGKVGLTFDGANDYIEDSKGRHVVKEGTTGFWSEVKIGDKTKIVGTGTKFYFSSAGDNLEGQFVSDFADYCTGLTHFYCNSNAFSGTLPDFGTCTNLTHFYCASNSFSGYATGGFATQTNLATLDASNNAITSAADINAILADLRTSYDLVGRVACTVKLEGGTNAAPTGQGVTDKNFLNANGWTVTTN